MPACKQHPLPFVTRLLPNTQNPSPHRSSELFLGNIATNWPVSATDQSNVNTFRSLDLQIGGIAASSTSISVPMKHKMGLVKITLGTKSVPTTRTYSASGTQPADATGMKYTDSSEKTTVTASSSFDPSCKPYTSDGYWYIVRGSTTSNTYTKTFKSVTTVNTDWEYANVSVNQGAYLNITVNNSYIKRLCYKFTALFSCTETCQAFKLPVKGTMTMQCWGASGGTLPGATEGSSLKASVPANNYSGGNGGYVSGTISSLQHYDNLYVYVGKAGAIGATQQYAFNGGGHDGGYTDRITNIHARSQGGGATDIRLLKHSYGSWGGLEDEMVLTAVDASMSSRLIVAGGGGGAGQYCWYASTTDDANNHGGDAGGLIGYSGNKAGTVSTVNLIGIPTGGTQVSGGTSGGQNGGFGYGGATGCGAGGGYYGGASGTSASSVISSGAGGSSYVSGHGGCSTLTYSGKTYTFNSPEIWDGLGYKWNSSAATSTRGFPNTAGSGTENGHTGNGYAKITLITPVND